MRKRHHKHWSKFESELKKSISTEQCDEVALLLEPTDAMLDAIDPLKLI
jgi:crotonobetainyl-CoA:carnitine CoA-transferase CaiB-like acyl-CoA transferase